MVTVRQSKVSQSSGESIHKDKKLSSSDSERSSKSISKPRRESGYKSDRSQEDETFEYPRDTFLEDLQDDV